MTGVLILGGRSDIGQAIARCFGREGFDLVLAARRAQELEPAVADLRLRCGVQVRAIEFNALDTSGHEAWVRALDPLPEVTVCVFGYLGDADRARRDFDEAARILHTNFTGAVSVLMHVANAYEARRAGAIIGIGSVAGDRARQSNYLYGSAKAGFAAFLAGLRNRLAPSGVQVLTVKPGYVTTRMTEGMNLPAMLTAQPEHVAEDILRAYKKKSDILYTLWIWRYIMGIIRIIPEFIFKKLRW